MNKPGVMIYFDILQVLERISDQDAGRLFRAILEYGRDGKIPALPDSAYVIWPLIQSRLDYDDERYYTTAYKRKYAAYIRWCGKKSEPIMPYKQWMETALREEDLNDPELPDAPDAYA